MTKWKLYLGASILGAGLLIKAGAPLVPVAIGLLVAAAVTAKRTARTTERLPR